MKKLMMLLAGIVIICIIASYVVYIKPYSVGDNEPAIKRSIEQTINLQPISIKQTMEIGHSKVVLFTFENQIGESIFDIGINKKLLNKSDGHGDSKIRYKIIKSGDTKYVILLGENDKLGSAKISVSGEIYNISIPNDRYFISTVKITDPHKSLIEWVAYFDKANKEVLRINLPNNQVLE